MSAKMCKWCKREPFYCNCELWIISVLGIVVVVLIGLVRR